MQHPQGQVGAVDHIVRPFPDGGKQLHLLIYRGFHRGTPRGQGVGAAALLIAADQGAYIRVHVQNLAVAAPLLQLVNGIQQLAEAVLLPHVRHQGHLFIAARRGDAQLRKAGHQGDGHIVHAVVVQILQHVGGPALSRAGQAGYD